MLVILCMRATFVNKNSCLVTRIFSFDTISLYLHLLLSLFLYIYIYIYIQLHIYIYIFGKIFVAQGHFFCQRRGVNKSLTANSQNFQDGREKSREVVKRRFHDLASELPSQVHLANLNYVVSSYLYSWERKPNLYEKMNQQIDMSNENQAKEFLNIQTFYLSQHTTFFMFYTLKQTFKVAKIEKLH